MTTSPASFPTALQKCYKIKKGPISKKYYYTPTLVSLTQDELTLFKIKVLFLLISIFIFTHWNQVSKISKNEKVVPK